MADVRRGDIVIVNLDPTIGVEIKKTRPAIVVSNNSINRFSQLVVVVPLTKNTAHISPSHVVIAKGTARLTFASKAVSEQIKAVDKQRIVKKLGTLPPAVLAQVERAVKTPSRSRRNTSSACALLLAKDFELKFSSLLIMCLFRSPKLLLLPLGSCIVLIAVVTVIADRPPHRSVRAELPHTVLTLDIDVQTSRLHVHPAIH